ncbi:MAG: TIGR01906 family membrane protein [Lachnospiraceae bacterium]|nr:TIGR01906 family membrane protein [Lachnospiraceae bacterium]
MIKELFLLNTQIRKSAFSRKNLAAAFLCTLGIFSMAIVFTLHFRSLYYFDIDHLDIPAASGYSKEVIRKNYDELIDYNSIFGPSELTLSDFTMSEEGKIHFEEVRRIFRNIEYASFVLIPLTLFLVIWQIRKKNASFFAVLSAFPTVLVAIAGLLVTLNWDFCFVLFHKIMFRNDYWIFNPSDDPVITILPDTYFLHAAILILFCVLAASLFSFLLYQMLRRKVSNNAKR